jgi:hypothetical protein
MKRWFDAHKFLLTFAAIALGLFLMLLAARAAHAAGAPAPDDPSFPAYVWTAIVNGEGWLLAGLALTVVVWVTRQPWSPLVRLLPWFASSMGGFVLLLAVSLLGAVGNSLIAGMPIGPSLIAGVKVAAMAALTYSGIKHAKEKPKPVDPDELMEPGGA